MFNEQAKLVLSKWRCRLGEEKYAAWFESQYLKDNGFRHFYYSAASQLGVLPNNNPIESSHERSSTTTGMKKHDRAPFSQVSEGITINIQIAQHAA